jgi:transcriptional regulator with XRE-family HTH domain
MKNTTSKKKLHKKPSPGRWPAGRSQPSEKSSWAYYMQGIEPTSEEINKAFPGYHPQWVQMSQRFIISPEVFQGLRLSLGMTVTQCAAYLRTDKSTVHKWEKGTSPVPFAEFELLRLVLENVKFKMTHSDWDGWFINEHGVLHSPDIGGKGFTPEQLVWSTMTRSEAALLRVEVVKLQAQIDAAIAENTALREMFLSNGVTDEVAAVQEKINALMKRINTARVIPFAPAQDEPQLQEKIA